MILTLRCFALLAVLVAVWSCARSAPPGKAESTCERIDRCSCRDSHTGHVVSLHALAALGSPAFHVRDRDRTQYTYYYDPCEAFTRSGPGSCENVAVCQTDKDADKNYNIGFGETAYFETNFSQLAVTYSGGPYDRQCSPSRISNTTVYLKCDKDGSVNSSKLHYYTEAPMGEYFFTLTSKCACPGGCPGPDRPYCPPEGTKGCACRLSSNGQLVNIESLDKPSAPLTGTSGSNRVYFNPCSAMASPGGCGGSTACVYSSLKRSYTSYGLPGTGNFSVDQQGNVSLNYQTRERNSTVRLVCDRSARQAPQFSVVSVSDAELVMELRYICACPGECLRPPVVCHATDSCSCTLTENLGTIDLHSLDNPVAPLRARALDPSGSWNTYYYNPCSNFSVVGTQGNCEGVAACQEDSGKRDWSLGSQRSVTYHVTQEEVEHDVSLIYTGGTDNRQVTVQLRCNPTLSSAQLSFLNENPAKNYHLILEGKEACPKNSTEPHLRKKPVELN